MSNSDIINPEVYLPLQFIDGDVQLIEQESDEDDQQRVYAILAYEPGQLAADPLFGTPSQVFSVGGVDLDALAQVVQSVDPSLSEVFSDDTPTWFSDLVQHISATKDPNQST